MVPHKSRGSRELNRQIENRGDQQKLASEMGSFASVVFRWRTGMQKPETASRMWLQEHRGIPWEWWDDESPDSEAADSEPANGGAAA